MDTATGLAIFIFLLLALCLLFIHHLRERNQRPERRAQKSDQLDLVSSASFSRKKLMNKSEFRIFKLVENFLKEHGGGYRVFAQTSMGEFIGSDNSAAFHCINSKRVDCFILGPFGDPVAAIEYQGKGHYLDNRTAMRDAVKKEALRRAGVPYIEILDSHTDERILNLIEDVFTARTAE